VALLLAEQTVARFLTQRQSAATPVRKDARIGTTWPTGVGWHDLLGVALTCTLSESSVHRLLQ
jgi:hypothetical protein